MDFLKSAVLVMGLWGAIQTASAQGQMFGNRQVGQPIGRQVGPSQPPDASTGRLQGNERFVRGNRQGNQFVGAAPETVANFVGQVNAAEQSASIEPAIGPPPNFDRARLINQPRLVRRPNSLLESPLQIGFQLPSGTTTQLGAKAQISINQALAAQFGSQISASVANQTATLHGAVGDEEQAQLAELLAHLEPGISQVENRIAIERSLNSNPEK